MSKKFKLPVLEPAAERRKLTILDRRNISKRKNFWINRIIESLKLKDFDLPSMTGMSIRDLRTLSERLETLKRLIYSEAREAILKDEDMLRVESERVERLDSAEIAERVRKAKEAEATQSNGFKTFKNILPGSETDGG